MPEGRDNQRVAVECADCGSVYAALALPDGQLQPIGAGECQCGSAEFSVIDGPTGSEFADSSSGR